MVAAHEEQNRGGSAAKKVKKLRVTLAELLANPPASVKRYQLKPQRFVDGPVDRYELRLLCAHEWLAATKGWPLSPYSAQQWTPEPGDVVLAHYDNAGKLRGGLRVKWWAVRPGVDFLYFACGPSCPASGHGAKARIKKVDWDAIPFMPQYASSEDDAEDRKPVGRMEGWDEYSEHCRQREILALQRVVALAAVEGIEVADASEAIAAVARRA
jgi:hypothetical protein